MESTDTSFQDLHWLLDVIQSTDVGIVVLDRDFNIEIFNRFMQVHGDISPEDAIGINVFSLFPELEKSWFERRINSVFDLGISVYTTWQEREHIFDFKLELPIHHDQKLMYQNSTFIPLRNARDEVERVALVIYDVTDSAINSIKLEQAKDELLLLSRTDRLTNLWNRGYWEERMIDEFLRNKRTKTNAALVMLDIDHFKNINDTYGHQVGDDSIREVSRLIKENSRAIDICGRYGGEEFTVLLPGTDLDGAKYFCERLRKAIEENEVRSGGDTVSFTVSLGICMWDERLSYPTDWLVSADKALYKSKGFGRNQTQVFGES